MTDGLMVFVALKLQVVVLCVMTPRSDVVCYECFGGTCCLHRHGEVSGAWIEIQVTVFWFMTPYSDIVGYQRFGAARCLHLQGEVSGLG
jgi:hypothetical protein